LFIAMWNWADDHGRGTANLKELEGFAFPNDAAFTDRSGNTVHFRALVAEVADAFGVVFYTVRGRPYYEIPSWDDHQRNERRSKESKHPSPQVEGAVAEIPCKRTETPHTSGPGTGEQGNRGTGEQGNPSHVPALPHQRTRKASRAEIRMAELNATSRTAAADNFAAQFAAWAGGIPRGTLIEIAQETDQLIADGIDAHQIADGIKAWHASDRLYPSQIPHFVAKAAKPNAPPKSTKATQRAIDTAAITAELIAEFHQEPA
jgi:hypothetical protein